MAREIGASILLVLLAGVVARLGSSAMGHMEAAAERLSRQKALTIVVLALLPAAMRLALLPWMPVPVPQAHDEFSHLLAADTFTHGRLTNPVPTPPSYFESPHILIRPSYASIYPPAQGVILALGKLLTGWAWAGVLLSVAAMTGSVCWMLQSWTSPGWALVGTTLLIIRLGVFSYWTNSYWGGAVAAFGGALILGALPRLKERRSIQASIALGCGIALLANSRPFEGAIFTALCVCLYSYNAKRVPILWPALLIVLAAIFFMGYHAYRITGNAFLPPYVFYRTTIAVAPHFTFLVPRSAQPHWEYQVLRDFFASEMHAYEEARARPVFAAMVSLEVYWRFYLSSLFSLPLIAALRDKKGRWLGALAGLFFLLALAPQVWHSPHYAAPATGVFILLITLGMQQLRHWSFRGRRPGPWLTRTLVLASLFFAVRIASVYPADNAGSRWTGWAEQTKGFNRASVVQQLATAQGHLVVVRYGVHHDPNQEWVYNEADIEKADVIWARDKGPFDNLELLQHFKDRKLWLVEPDRAPPRFSLYPANLIVEPEELAHRIQAEACAPGPDRRCALTCDQWNFFFSKVTQLEAPNVSAGCTDATHRAQSIAFEPWLSWIRTWGL